MKDWIHRTEAVGVADLVEMARECGLLGAGQSMSPELLAYTQAVVEQCASIADAYPPERNRGKRRRAHSSHASLLTDRQAITKSLGVIGPLIRGREWCTIRCTNERLTGHEGN